MELPHLDLPIRTQRLLLRDFAAPDWEAVHAYASRDDVCRFMPWGPNDEDASRAYIGRALDEQSQTPRETYQLAVIETASDRLVGGVGLYIKSWQNRDGFVGYCFHSNVWGQGYATEAAGALVDAGFSQLDLHRIWSTCDDENLASARVMEKLGWQQEGLLRQDVNLRGQWRDSRLLAILRPEWEARQG
ncbi:MAG: GNAT family N-acetyltransferase [Gemmatimonadetes bacterium]|jgi:[ribosomal protein S5]-alanine N-acetyltransferase|nr:GNAT family N-acetyltransferase [Gemmatimonadota bacterium]MBT6144132.1 GNAT family N-acetyltransferase [Gemmatimonadota bacterium]MBT7859861.1 GNAT family N-acetyltransferase [Gemmatimonadota bacterium]